MGFSRQEYCSGLPCHPPGDLPDPQIEPTPLMSPALTGGFFTTVKTGKSQTPSYLTVTTLSADNSSLPLYPIDSIHLSSANTDQLLSWIGPAISAKFSLPKDRKCLQSDFTCVCEVTDCVSDFTMSCVPVSEKYFLHPVWFSSCLQMESFLVPSLFYSWKQKVPVH